MKKIEVRPEKVRGMGNLIPPLSVFDFELSDCMIHEEDPFKINGHLFNHFSIDVPVVPVNLVLSTNVATIYPDATTPNTAVITATLTDSSGAPVSNVDVYFQEEGVRIGTASTNAQGACTFEYSNSSGGTHTIRAYTAKQGKYNKSSAEINLNVYMPTSLSLSPVSTSANTVDIVTLSSKIIDQNDLPLAGKLIDLYHGNVKIKSAYSNSKGIVEFPIRVTDLGKTNTVLTCTTDKTSVTVGENVLCTLYLKDNQNNPLANKTVYCGDWSKTTNEEGRVIFNYANPSTGAVTKVFKFDGDTSYKGASVTANWTVNKKPVNITVTVDKTSVTVGETVTLTATVKSDGVNVNEGQVDFGDGVLVDVSNGTAVKTFTKTTPTVLTVTPSYKGTSTYTTATASSLTLTWVEEQVTPEISISASDLIGEVGDDLPITLSSNLKNTALTVLLNDAEIADSVTTDNAGNAVFNYNCNGAGDVNVKVKYLSGTNVYYSNILNLEDCLFYDTMTSESDRWVRTSDIIVNIDSEGTKLSTNSTSEQLYKLPSKYFTPPYTIEFDWITGGGAQKMALELFPNANCSGAACWYGSHWDEAANKFVIGTYPSSTSSSKTEADITRDINPNDHLKFIVEPNSVKLYQNGEFILSKRQGKTCDTQYFSFFTNKNRIQKVKNLKIKHYSE